MKRLSNIKYIYDNPENGIEYDWDLIFKELRTMLKKCKAPEGLYDPTNSRIKDYYWNVFMSERSTSKTTQFLLLCCVMNALYGTVGVYVRKLINQTTRTYNNDLFKIITKPEYGYIEYLTDGKYNDIVVNVTSKRAYYVHRDKDGVITDTSKDSIIDILHVEDSGRYRSAYNNPVGDMIIFDEFATGLYTQDEFFNFSNNILATVRRERISVHICMLSNTVSPYNQYLKELGVAAHVAKMHKGDCAVITAKLGARVYVEYLDVEMHKTEKFKKAALDYYGFENPLLKSIYGGEWEYKNFPRLPKEVMEKTEVLYRDIYIKYMAQYRCIEVRGGEIPCIRIRPYYKEPDDNATIFVVDEAEAIKPNVYLANRVNMRFLLWARAQGRVYYATNEDGIILEEFTKLLKI